MKYSKGYTVSGNEFLRTGAGEGIGMGGKSGGVEGELASEPWSDTSDGVRWILREKDEDEGDSGELDGRVVGRW